MAEQMQRNVRRVEIWHHQKIGAAVQMRVRKQPIADLFGYRRIRPHLALDLEIGAGLDDQSGRAILRRNPELDEPKLECDSRAAFGATPKRRTTSAASRVISAISASFGSLVTSVSVMKGTRR